MKKWAIILGAALALSLCACGMTEPISGVSEESRPSESSNGPAQGSSDEVARLESSENSAPEESSAPKESSSPAEESSKETAVSSAPEPPKQESSKQESSAPEPSKPEPPAASSAPEESSPPVSGTPAAEVPKFPPKRENLSNGGYSVTNYDDAGTPVTQEVYDYYGELEYTAYYENGRQVRREYVYSAGLTGWTGTTYLNESGRPSRYELFNLQGALDSYILYFYDEKGNEIRSEGRKADGTLENYTLREYDEKGNLTVERIYDGTGKPRDFTFYENGNRSRAEIYNAEGTIAWKRFYDETGISTAYVEDYNPDGTLQRISYYQDGKIDYISYFEGDKEVRREYYDRFGNLTETIEYDQTSQGGTTE